MIGKILEKLLPLERIIALALKIGLLKKPLELAAQGYRKAQGVRTQSSLALAGAVAIGAVMGVIPWDQAHGIILSLVGAAIPTALEKVERVLGIVGKAHAEVVKEAEQPNK